MEARTRSRQERSSFCDLLSLLLHRTADGGEVAAIVTEATLTSLWQGKTDARDAVDDLIERQLIRRVRARIGADSGVYLTLWHDRLVTPLSVWLQNRNQKKWSPGWSLRGWRQR